MAEPFENIAVVFSVGGLTDTVEIVPPGGTILQAQPSSFVGNGAKTITLRYLGAGGEPIPGVQIGVTCTSGEGGSAAVSKPPGVTDENGETEAVVVADVDGIGGGGSAQCTFFPAGGPPPEAVVTFTGIDLCDFSPQPAGCSEEGGGG